MHTVFLASFAIFCFPYSWELNEVSMSPTPSGYPDASSFVIYSRASAVYD